MSIKLVKVVNQKNAANTATVIFLHGSGDTGHGVHDWITFLVGDLNFPHIKFLFPTAPVRPYTPLQGQPSTVWFDRKHIAPSAPEHQETTKSACSELKTIIDKEISSGIPLKRIVVGGFSMGGALALHMAYRSTPGLAGVFALSSFLNRDSSVYTEFNGSNETRLFMRHGDRDTLVRHEWGKETYDKLVALGAKGEFETLKNALHELKKNELEELFKWILDVLPEKQES